MELFSELKNDCMQQLITVINKNITDQKTITTQDFSDFHLFSAADSLLESLLFKNNDRTYTPIVSTSVPVILTKLEQQWLNDLLNDNLSSLFLTEELRKKIQSKNNLKTSSWIKQSWHNNQPNYNFSRETAEFKQIFQNCLTALQQKKYVYYESYDDYGLKYQGEAAPFKIEYDMCSNIFNFIMWNPDKCWTFKSNIATITKLQVLSQTMPDKVYMQAQAYVEAMQINTPPIVLQLKTNKNNALERCILLFSTYEKNIHILDEQTIQLEIMHRDHFDKKEILQYILSLGSAVTVISPQTLKQEIITCIQEAYTRQKD